ncbi:MAG: hypothetical protein MK116_00565 [Phycisphaerales bacterium]|nr:hypothetical protein [Phycisphaerales bacterium]
MRMRLAQAGLHLQDCRTRLPFRFGMHTLTSAPLGTLHVQMLIEGGGAGDGHASDLLVPKWFEKDPAKTPAEDIDALIASATTAIDVATELGNQHRTVFDLCQEIWNHCLDGIPIDAPDRLVHGWGPSLVERAIIDAACRAATLPFHEALRSGLLAFDAGRLDDAVADWTPDQLAPPRDTITLRHTVGLADALHRSEIQDPVNDGLPESLDEDIEAHGLTHFKVKVGGDIEQDLDRLLRVADVVLSRVETPAFTLDGNEQYRSMSAVAELLDRLNENPQGKHLLENLLLIEQPLSRSITFQEEPNQGIEKVSAHAPVIIDEADGDRDSLHRAAALGYGGVSAKNCKGVFRAVLNRARCQGTGLVLSAEDLTTLPVIAVQQDLVTVATLGLTHVERNGHHYFRGLDHLPGEEADLALHHHPDLYERHGQGDTRLRIRDGALEISSLHQPGFGYAEPPDLSLRTPVDQWQGSEDLG